MSRARAAVLACLVLGAGFSGVGAAQTLVLITEDEASRPDEERTRGITLGPHIEVISPPPNGGWVSSPFGLRATFTSYGGAKVDIKTLVVTYQKDPAIDLTERVRPFVGPEGVYIPGVEVPPGVHRLLVEVRDTDGRWGARQVLLRVLRPKGR